MTVGHRLTSRVLLYDEAGRVLLFLTKAPDTSGFARWITPGGGVDAGETHADAAVRELFEETGLQVDGVGAPVWTHDFSVGWDNADHDTGHAEFYVVSTAAFEPVNTNWTPEEHVDVEASRWWSADELRATSKPFEPAELPDLIELNLPPQQLVAVLRAQEDRLQFGRFTHSDAWQLGSLLVRLATERGLGVTVDITRGDQQVFHAALEGTTADNDAWVARKIRTVRRFEHSSYLIGREHAAAGKDFGEATGLPLARFAAHGGCFPIVVRDSGVVGTVTVSGLPQALDHALVVEAIGSFLAR